MDALNLYRLTPKQVEVLKGSAGCRETLLRGGNRSGKSHTAALRFASIVRDRPLIAMDGTAICCRAKHQVGRPLICWIIGLQLDHIGQTIHRLLFRPGMFDIVRDPVTDHWRAWHPPMFPDDFNTPMNKRKQAPPLIPPSEVKEWSWEKKTEHQFSMCRLHNGTEIYAFASSAPVKAGDPVDEIWVDEEIKTHTHYAEWQARLPDRDGRIFWSSWPSNTDPALYSLSRRCQQQEKDFNSGEIEFISAREFRLKFSENPFFTKRQIDVTIAGWPEAERAARDLGEFQSEAIRLYGDFSEDYHRVDYLDPAMDDEISRVLRRNGWVPPENWTRYFILDPGTAKPGFLMMAVPPPELWGGDFPVHIAYREIYQPRLDAYALAKAVRSTEEGFLVQQFIIDGKAAQQTPMGFSGTVGERYSEAFASEELSSIQMPGSGFIPGDPNKAARSFALRSMMRTLPSGRPGFRIVAGRCPALVQQLRETVRYVTREEGKDEPAPGQPIDILVCAEYYASRSPTYVPVPDIRRKDKPSVSSILSRIDDMFPKTSGREKSSTKSSYFGA